MKSISIKLGKDIPEQWGEPQFLRKSQLVSTRIPEAGETFVLDWGTLVAEPEDDLIIQVEGQDQYPIKIAEFEKTYVLVGENLYQKVALTKVVPIPEGVEVEMLTLEGKETAQFPDAVAVGVSDEVWAFPLLKNTDGVDPPFEYV